MPVSTFDGIHERLYEMRGGFEDVWPDEVHEVNKSVLATKAKHSERHVLDGGAGGLPVNQIAVHQRVFQQRDDGVDVVLAHFPDVFEEEGERF